MTRYTMYTCRLKCVSQTCGRTVILDVERKEDITQSWLTDTLDPNAQGFAVYRDRTPLQCPYCKSPVKLLPGGSTVDVDFTPGNPK